MASSAGQTRERARRIGAVERALLVLDALGEAGGEIGTNELARRTGVNASTVSRVLATLARAGYVEQTPTGRYRLGLRLLQLGSAALDRLDLRALARPPLEELARETGETATLSVPGEQDAITVDFVRSPSAVQGVAQVGRPSVPHATATGKVLLAFGPGGAGDGPFQRFTPRTIVTPSAVRLEVERTRERGWADADGEREPDLAALAAPVRSSRGELVAILGLQGPSTRFDDAARSRALPRLVTAADALSRRLGWTP
jgi:IclR family acetate operon transcriptional repressor